MKRFLLPVLAATALAASPASAQITSSLNYQDGNEFFQLCAAIGCTQTVNLNVDTADVFVQIATGFFDAQLDPGLENLVNPLPALSITRLNANQFQLNQAITWLFDGVPNDGLASAGVQFDVGSIFNATQSIGPGLVSNSNLVWQFDPTKISFGTAGFPSFPAGTTLETASFSINSSRTSTGATVGSYGVTVQAVTPSVPGPLGVAGVGGAFVWSRQLRRRISQG